MTEPNKELPKEVQDILKQEAKTEKEERYYGFKELPAFADGLGKGAKFAQSHYAPIIEAKDKEI